MKPIRTIICVGLLMAIPFMAKHAEEYSPHADGKEAAKSFIPAKEASTK